MNIKCDTIGIEMLPLSIQDLTRDLLRQETTATSTILLVDVRPNAQFCSGHIKSAENVNFSNILLRRLLKGVVSLESMLSSSDQAQKIAHRREDCKMVVYDWCSNEDGVKVELAKHAEVLAKASNTGLVYFLKGGFDAFSAQQPDLCKQESATSMQSQKKAPLGISVSTSLPLGCTGYQRKVASRRPLLTPSEDDPNRFGPPVEVLPFLVLGCAKDSANLTQLRKMGVTAILNVSHNCPNHFETLFEYKCIPVQDSHQADLLSKLQTAFDFINSIKEKGGKVFVHCHAGISRSATVCIAYVMKHHQKDLTQAYDFIKERRPCISPNLHFMGQLLEFQKQLQPSRSPSLSDDSPVEEMDSESVHPTPLPTDCTVDFTPRGTVKASFSVTPTTVTQDELLHISSPGYQIPVSVPHQQASDCSSTRGSKRSISVPGSIGFSLAKPKKRTQPKFPVRYNPTITEYHCSTDSVLHSHSASTMISRPSKLNLTSISLPSTPVNQNKSHLSLSSRFKLTPQELSTSCRQSSLQMSPCRVVAKTWDFHNGQDLASVPTTIAL